MRLRRVVLFVSALVLAMSTAVYAQDVPPKIWDVPLGTPVDSLGVDFVEPACGTDGGPPSIQLASFADFARCAAEPDGLREIWFRYDDTLEYLARALRDPVQTIRLSFTKVGDQPAILSLLVDDQGRIRGYRVHTDPAADPKLRYNNQLASATMRAVLGTAWVCSDLPKAEGEGPIEGIFVKQRCELDGDGFHATNETRFYLKPGQAVVDPATGKPMLNAFESSAYLNVTQATPYPADEETLPLVPAPHVPAAGDKIGMFIAGLSKDCAGCDLSGADLRRRDLTGADLSGAKLVATNLHRAILRQVNFRNADLERADLNVADLTQADFTGANMVSTMLYGARGTQTLFTGATMRAVRAGAIEIRQGNFEGANLTTSDFGQARLNDARLAKADLTGAYFFQASLIRADMEGVKASRTAFNQAVLRDANLSNALFADADFQTANLLAADLSNSDFTHVRFEKANIRDTNRTGTILTGSLMPDGSIAP
jgi:uncharacterized protein YjbI with pentapeptide repeats